MSINFYLFELRFPCFTNVSNDSLKIFFPEKLIIRSITKCFLFLEVQYRIALLWGFCFLSDTQLYYLWFKVKLCRPPLNENFKGQCIIHHIFFSAECVIIHHCQPAFLGRYAKRIIWTWRMTKNIYILLS